MRRQLKFKVWRAEWDRGLGVLGTIVTVALVWSLAGFSTLNDWWVVALIVGSWLPWLLRQAKLTWLAWKVARQVRVFDHITNSLRSILSRFERR